MRLPARARSAKVDDRADDFASALLAIHDEDPEALSHEEIASILFSLSFAGHETTNYLIGNLVRRLLEEPARWDAVVADLSLIGAAVEETLRFDTSVPVWRRITTRPARLGGVELPEGAKLFPWLAAAGRDPATIPEPERFDLGRANAKRHLAFGKGMHYCAGASSESSRPGWRSRASARGSRGCAWCPTGRSRSTNISFRGPQSLWVDPRG